MTKPRLRASMDAMSAAAVWPAFTGGGAYHGASFIKKDVSEWYASGGSADSDLLPDLPELQRRARDIRRNNGLAHGLVETHVDAVVGSGIRFCSQPDWVTLSKFDARYNEAWAEAFAEQYEALFHEWWWSTACHAGDTKTGDMLAEEVYYSKLDNGGSLTLPLWIPNRGDGFSTKLQTVEIDRLCNPTGKSETTRFHGGIEFDQFGVPIAYHIKKTHPGDSFFLTARDFEWERIPRTTSWGRLRVIHDFDADRADQTRGVPLLSAVLDQFKNIDRYAKAELRAAILNAMIWGAITTPLEHNEIVELFNKDKEAYMAARNAHAVKMEAGTLATLFPGDKLEPFMPSRPASQFGVFVENIEKIITVGTGTPHVIGKKDYSKSNYSNTRAAMLDAWRKFTRSRDRLGAGWFDRVNTLFGEEVVNAGRVDVDAATFRQFKRSILRGTWIGPARGYIDKEKEVKGDVLAVASNQDTLQRIAATQGMHWKDLLRQRAREEAFAQSLKLTTAPAPSEQAMAAANGSDSTGEDTNDTGEEATGTDQ